VHHEEISVQKRHTGCKYIYTGNTNSGRTYYFMFSKVAKKTMRQRYEMPTFSKPRPFVKGALPVAISAASTC
jgi:hypothetical protein